MTSTQDNSSNNYFIVKAAEPGTYSQVRHILQTTISNLGSSIIVYGALFKKNGIISSCIAVTIICAVSTYTILLMVQNSRSFEPEFQYSLYRAFGKKMFNVYNYQMILYLVVCSMMFQILMASLFHSLISQFLESVFDYKSSSQDNFSFRKFSYQWAGIINFCLGFLICNIKDFTVLMKIASKAFITNFFVFFYVTYQAIYNRDNIHKLASKKQEKDSLFSTDYINTFGVFMYGFLVHPYMIQMARKNKRPETNCKTITIAMVLSYIAFIYFGIIGDLGIIGRQKNDGTEGSTVLQYYPTTKVVVIIMSILYLLHLFINFPFMALIARQCTASLVYGDMSKETKKFRYIFLTIYLGICLLVQVSNYQFDSIMTIDGSIIGYFSMFVFPVILQVRKRLIEYGFIKDNSEQNKILFLTDEQIQQYKNGQLIIPKKEDNESQGLIIKGRSEAKWPDKQENPQLPENQKKQFEQWPDVQNEDKQTNIAHVKYEQNLEKQITNSQLVQQLSIDNHEFQSHQQLIKKQSLPNGQISSLSVSPEKDKDSQGRVEDITLQKKINEVELVNANSSSGNSGNINGNGDGKSNSNNHVKRPPLKYLILEFTFIGITCIVFAVLALWNLKKQLTDN